MIDRAERRYVVPSRPTEQFQKAESLAPYLAHQFGVGLVGVARDRDGKKQFAALNGIVARNFPAAVGALAEKRNSLALPRFPRRRFFGFGQRTFAVADPRQSDQFADRYSDQVVRFVVSRIAAPFPGPMPPSFL